MSLPTIAVIGAGAVGSFLAARLSTVTETLLVTRDRSVARFQSGIDLVGSLSGRYPVPVVGWSGVTRFPDGALLLITPKIFQLPEVLPLIAERLGRDHRLVLCQNGLGVVDEAERYLPGQDWGRAVAWFGSRLEPPATVHVAGVYGMEVTGADDQAMTGLTEALERAGIPPLRLPDVATVEWRKALCNVTTNGLCALAEAPNGAAVDDPWLHPLAEALVDEAMIVARAEGVVLTADDRARVFAGAAVTRANWNSTLQDLWAGRPTEMPWMNGAVVARAERHDLAVPSHRMIDHLVRYLEASGSRAKHP